MQPQPEQSLKLSYLDVKEHLEQRLEDKIQQSGVAEGDVPFNDEMRNLQTTIDTLENYLQEIL